MRTVLLGTYPSLRAKRLREFLGPGQVIVPLLDEAGAAETAVALAEAEVIVSNHFDAAKPPVPRLRLFQSPSAGLERIEMSSIPSHVPVAAALGHEIPMAEYILCAVLDHAIGFRGLADTFEDGRWRMSHWVKGPLHGEVFGKTLGLIGFGAVSREVAVRARALGMRVTALSRWSRGRPEDSRLDATFLPGERAQFLSQADYLVVTVPLAEETRSYVDSAWFDEMKPTAVLINVARGPVVDEAALYQALISGCIGGAVLDVWYGYPSDDGQLVEAARFPFHRLPNVVMTPHASGRTEGTMDRRWRGIAANILSLEAGQPLQGLVTR